MNNNNKDGFNIDCLDIYNTVKNNLDNDSQIVFKGIFDDKDNCKKQIPEFCKEFEFVIQSALQKSGKEEKDLIIKYFDDACLPLFNACMPTFCDKKTKSNLFIPFEKLNLKSIGVVTPIYLCLIWLLFNILNNYSHFIN